ncbi:MAG: hypothetical protein WA821_19925 [Anaerolineales bacterium]
MNQLPKKSLRILLKAALLFVVFNYAFSFVPDSVLWRVSLFNTILPGEARFPKEDNLDLIFNMHEIASSPRRADEYKVIALGDSSVWGYSLEPNETFAGIINAAKMSTCKGRPIHVYNLGYPGTSVFKDALILQQALTYKPDLIIWNVTLLSVLDSKIDIDFSVLPPSNPEIAQGLIEQYKLSTKITPTTGSALQDRSFLNRREQIARFIKYQLDGIRWQAAGRDPVDKATPPLAMDVAANKLFKRGGIFKPEVIPNQLEFDVLNAGIRMAGNTPVVIINEPILVVDGANSDIRYDEVYPHWAYDQYRALMAAKAKQYHWDYTDLWNIVPPSQFTSIFHRTVKSEKVFAQIIQDIIKKNTCP